MAAGFGGAQTVYDSFHTPKDRDFSPPNDSCGGSGLRVKTYWSPPRETNCGWVAYPPARCREWAVTLDRRQIEYEKMFCTGCVVADSGFVPYGTCKMAEGF